MLAKPTSPQETPATRSSGGPDVAVASNLLFPSVLVAKARHNELLQVQHHPGEAQRRYRDAARRCPACGARADALSWVYYRSEPWTWLASCGTGGWLTLCDPCETQVDYFLEELSEHGRTEPIRVATVQPSSLSA